MQQPSGDYRLIVRRGPQPNQIHELNKDVITLGRDITNDITINDPEVSRHHARLTRGGGGFTMEDLGSTNGTFVNGQRLTGARPLSPGDMIGLGETVTLAYESTALAGMATAVGGVPPGMGAAPSYAPPPPQPQQQSPYAPPPPGGMAPPAYGQQPSVYAPPPPTYGAPPPMYGGESQPSNPYAPADYQEPERSGMGRWLLLGCGCFIVLCVISAVVLMIVVDQTCAWEQEPLSSVLDVFGLQADQGFQACQ